MNLTINKQRECKPTSFYGYYCDKRLCNLKRIKKIIKDDTIASNLFNDLQEIKKNYGGGLWNKKVCDVFIKSKNPDGKIENITDIVAIVDISKHPIVKMIPNWVYNETAIFEKNLPIDLTSTHFIESSKTSREFIEEVINAPDKLSKKIGSFIDDAIEEMCIHPEMPSLNGLKEHY